MANKKQVFPDNWSSSSKEGEESDIFPNIENNQKHSDSNDESFFKNLQFEGGMNKAIGKSSALTKQKEKMTLIREFIQALNEISPLVDNINVNGNDHDKFSQDLTGAFVLQGAIVKLIGEKWEVNGDGSDEKYILSLLAKHTSKLIQEGIIKNINDKERILSILNLIEEFVEERPYIGSLIEQDMLSEDILVNVKNALFPASLRFHTILTNLKLKKTTIFKWVKWHNNMTVNLAKDLAFNWDKTANFKDRESLFEGSISYCSTIASDVWYEHFSKNLNDDLSSYDEITLWSKLPELEDAIEAFDMGYLSHDEFGMDWLKRQICQHFLKRAGEFKRIEVSNISPMALELHIIEKYLRESGKAWAIASENAIAFIEDKLSSMTEEQQEAWMENDGSKPMPLDLFYRQIEDLIGDNILEECSYINEIDLLKSAKGKLAMIWGLSDAVCKVKRKD